MDVPATGLLKHELSGERPAPLASKRRRSHKKGSKELVASTGGRFHCNNCARDISDTVRIRCAVCVEYDLCIDCFSIGAETDDHRCDHDYRVLEVVEAELFEDGWTAAEEERLLEALEYYGIGNWADVATMIGGGKNAEYARVHYQRAYLDATRHCLPDIHRHSLLPRPPPELAADPPEPDPRSLKVMHEHTIDEMSGYMPKRGDFVYEWDNEREEILADTEIEPNEHARDIELKTRLMEIYNQRLDGRRERREFALQSGLWNLKAKERMERQMSTELREVWDKSRPLFRFAYDRHVHERLLLGLVQERQLRERIEELTAARERLEAHTLAQAAPLRHTVHLTPGIGRVLPPPEQLLRQVLGASAAAVASLDATQRERLLRAHGYDLYFEQCQAWTSPRKQSGPELFCMDGVELLSRAEIDLCAALRMSPHQYLVCKQTLVMENARAGSVRRKDVRNVLGIDDRKACRLYDALVSSGVVLAAPASGPPTTTAVAAPREAAIANATAVADGDESRAPSVDPGVS
ncbi:hypothetical protein CDCA_CDCA06G1752 [Cyanidium caldarium]|uniref:Transcriptional adapter n=1 Tax=Cyanidium caldarium TaxID=2771 RepID=A0AAV9ITR7_CYACA|nr:hypothetical protein CDCA_CDCA06G1752 [Cyanidium caldarium]